MIITIIGYDGLKPLEAIFTLRTAGVFPWLRCEPAAFELELDTQAGPRVEDSTTTSVVGFTPLASEKKFLETSVELQI